ncbi:hypothetical protein ACP70R_046942 [Stipagrostis hirtigluma subsp. patula]
MADLPLIAAAGSPPPSRAGRVAEAYKKALETVATVTACAVLARSIPRDLLPEELRSAASWCAARVRARLGWRDKERCTVVIRRCDGVVYGESQFFHAARTYLDATIDPRAIRRLSLVRSRVMEPDGRSSGWSTLLCMEPGCSTTDVFDGVEFTWRALEADDDKGKEGAPTEALELSYDAEHTDTALDRYVPFVESTAARLQRQERALRIFINDGKSWRGISHHHPATFDTLAMETELKQSIIADLDRFLERRDFYRRIGKAWKRGYLLHGPPGTGKSTLVAAMANYLRFNLYDLDLSEVYTDSALKKLLIDMSDKSILVIEDIDCCFKAAASREDGKASPEPSDAGNDSPPIRTCQPGASPPRGITLSGLLNFIDGLWSTCGEERIIVFTTNYKDRLDPALLRPGRMDMHVYMDYCGWEAFKTLARNHFRVDEHALFPEIQDLLSAVEVTPADVSEMLLRSDDADDALGRVTEFLRERKGAEAKDVAEKAM